MGVGKVHRGGFRSLKRTKDNRYYLIHCALQQITLVATWPFPCHIRENKGAFPVTTLVEKATVSAVTAYENDEISRDYTVPSSSLDGSLYLGRIDGNGQSQAQ